MIQKLRVDPPAKFTGTENFDGFYKRLVSYMSRTDESFGFIMTKIKDRQKQIFTCNDYDDCDTHLTLEAGTTSRMNRVLYYTLGSLAGDAAWLILDTTPEMNGFEALRRLIDRYMHSKQMK